MLRAWDPCVRCMIRDRHTVVDAACVGTEAGSLGHERPIALDRAMANSAGALPGTPWAAKLK